MGAALHHHFLDEEYYQLEDRIEKEMEEWNSQMISSPNPHCWEVSIIPLDSCLGSNRAIETIM